MVPPIRRHRAVTPSGAAACALPAVAFALAALLASGCAPGPSQPDLPEGGETWTWSNPRPFGESVEALWGADPRDVHAVGEDGLILHFDGSRWDRIPSRTDADLHDVHGCASDDVYAVGAAGTILHFDGSRWSRIAGGNGLNLIGVRCLGPNDVHAVSELGVALHFDGDAWSETQLGLGDADGDYQAVWSSPDGRIFAVGRLGTVSRFDGVEWTSLDPGGDYDLFHVAGRNDVEVYATGRDLDGDGVVVRWNGLTWRRVSWPVELAGAFCFAGDDLLVADVGSIVKVGVLDPMSVVWEGRPPSAMLGFPDGDALAVGPSGLLLDNLDGSWRTYSSGPTFPILALRGPSCDALWAVGRGGGIMRSGGGSWTVTPAPVADDLRDVWAVGPADAWAVGDDGLILRWDGTAWTPWRLVSGETLRGVWGAAADDVYVCGDGDVLLHYDGVGYEPLLPFWHADCRAVGGRGPDDVYVCTAENVLHYDGENWRSLGPSESGMSYAAMWISPDTDDLFIGGRYTADEGEEGSGIVCRYDGTMWRCWLGGVLDEVRGLWGLAPDDVYAATPRGVVRFDGETWEPEPELAGRRYETVWGDPGCGVFAAGPGGEIRHETTR